MTRVARELPWASSLVAIRARRVSERLEEGGRVASMNIVASIMRQHRRIQRLHALIKSSQARGTRLDERAMGDLAEAVLAHTGSTEELLGNVRDERIERDLQAHRMHHSRVKLAFFRVATCTEASLAAVLEQLESVLREHALHEAKVVQRLTQVFGEDVLEVLGEQMTMLDPAAAMPVEPPVRIERCA